MKRFTVLFIVCFTLFPLFHACNVHYGKSLKGNRQIVHEEMAIDDYESISLNLPAEVIYRHIPQEKPFLQVSVDENLLPLLDISVHNGRLTLNQKENIGLQASHFVIYTNSRHLSRVSIGGSGNVVLEKEVNAQNMEIVISGSGNLKTDSLYCELLDVQISGAGDADLNGAATRAQYAISGAGDIHAFDYLVEDLDCRISGAGDIRAYVDKKLYARISGTGNIRYKGSPETVDKQVSGLGSISQTK
ncbi:MAG: DUF2807 domain-containing protein [Dysgonamonadaceae bacterium]|jgi:hypothetical protein|nr:DUF2807 domain-containing protein [Dysgonamonadaceae bacterium]